MTTDEHIDYLTRQISALFDLACEEMTLEERVDFLEHVMSGLGGYVGWYEHELEKSQTRQGLALVDPTSVV